MHLAPSRHRTSEGTEHHHGASPEHLDVDEAGARVLAAFRPLGPVEVPLDDALGLVTAAPVQARQDLPPFDNSAMDGFALRVEDTAGASEVAPVRLRVIGNAPAGYRADTDVAPGTAMRIMTGAPVPTGADAVIRFEHVVELEGDHVAVPRPA
jgi:molybdopterin molybdotransferase